MILVVGGAGYIGSHVVKDLLSAGNEIVVFDNLSSGLRENLQEDATFVHGDIMRPESIREVFSAHQVEAVVHLAALKAAGESMEYPQHYANANLVGTIHLMNEMVNAGVSQMIFSSSAAVYGEPQYLPMNEDHPLEPTNFYGLTKLQIEQLLSWYAKLKDFKFVALRYFNAAGYDPAGEIGGLELNPNNLLPVIAEVVVGIRGCVEVYGDDYETSDGSCVRDYIHVSDLADAHTKALDYLRRHDESQVVNLGTSIGVSVFEMIETFRKLSGKPIECQVKARRKGDPPHSCTGFEKANQVLNWSPQLSDKNTIVQTMLQAYSKKL